MARQPRSQKDSDEIRSFLVGLGQRLKSLRHHARLTQKAVAAQIGVDWSVIRNYEGGLTQPPAFTLFRLAKAFSVSVDYLLSGEGSSVDQFSDKELLECCLRADALDPLRRGVLKEFVDTLVFKSKLEKDHHRTSSKS